MKIQLHNFKCWKDKSIDFQQEGIILLSGKSGAGKTSILEATINEYYKGIDIKHKDDYVLYINNLQEQGIQYYRNEVKNFDHCSEKHLITSPEIDNQIELLFPNTDGLKIGVSWKDFDLIKNSTKYLSNSDVSKVIEFGNNTFINLQFGDVSNDLIQINDNSKNKIHHIPGINYSENVESYASIIKKCDLIISVDNMTAHLAARLGKPVWILLSNNCDYKWQEKTENSIWYKNTLLLRQTNKNDWSKIIGYINSALK